MDKRIYLCLAHMSGKEMGFIQEAFDTNWVVPLGPNVNAFEQELEHFVGQNKKVVALSAGTAAVHLALLACGVHNRKKRTERHAARGGVCAERLQTPALFCGRVLFLLSFNVRLQVSFLLSYFVAQGVDALPCSLPLVR